MDYIIGIDCGSTKTSVKTYDLDGTLIAQSKSYAANFSTLGKDAVNVVVDAIDSCIQGIYGKCILIVLGASGMRGSGLSSFSEICLSERYKTKVVAVDDGVLALKSSIGSKNGMIVISGTGSVVYGQRNGCVQSFGGWGHLLGERGCAYSVVISAFKSMTDRFDSSSSLSELDKVLLEKLNMESPLHIPSFVYKASKADIASLAIEIERAADHDCYEAVEIQKIEGEKLADMIINLSKQMNIVDFPLATIGSLINKCKYVRNPFISRLKDKGIGVHLLEGNQEPESAVITYYREMYNVGNKRI